MSVQPLTDHPAKFNKAVLDRIQLHLRAEARARGRQLLVLDPFAGVGRIHDIPERIAKTVGVELEPEWASCRTGTIVGDATALPRDWTARFDAVATSPCYGNRMADNHEAKDSCYECKGTGVDLGTVCSDAPWLCDNCARVDCVCGLLPRQLLEHNRGCPHCAQHRCKACGGNGLSKRHTYRHTLGRPPSANSGAVMQWGDDYRALHSAFIAEMWRVLQRRGPALINMKNHERDHHEQHVVEWWAASMTEAGFVVHDIVAIEARGTRHGANHRARVDHEQLIVARKP